MAAYAVLIEDLATEGPPARADRWAWWTCWLMFASTVLCYMDRQAIALVRPLLASEFRIPDDETYGWLIGAFYLSYALFQVPAGFLADSGNVRTIYAAAVAGWSLAGVASAFSPSLGFLIACRVLLGVGESFNWPCGLRITAKVLPPADRGLGNGIFNSGAAVGAVITPLTVPLLAQRFGWRAAFATLGLLGFAWTAAWIASGWRNVTMTPSAGAVERSGRLSGTARGAFAALALAATLVAGSASIYGRAAVWWGIAVLMIGGLLVALALPTAHLAGRGWAASLGAIVRHRRFWVLVVVSVTINVSWHFLVNWMAQFFQQGRAWGMLAGGMVSVIPFLAADAGNLAGGGLSRRLARGGAGLGRSRVIAMGLASVLIASGATVGAIRNEVAVVVVLSLMALGVAAFMANYFALCQDVSPSHTGLVVGLLGGLGNLFAAGFMPLAGRLQDVTKGYGASFAIAGLLPLVGLAALVLGWGRDADPTRSA